MRTDLVQRWIAAGRLHPIHRGVYALGRPELTRDGFFIAAVLACGPGALLSHGSAASLWRLTDRHRGIDVTAPTRRHRPGITTHRLQLHPEDRQQIRGIPVASVPLTLLAVAAAGDANRFERAYEAAERLDLLDGRALDRLLERRSNAAGSKLLRRARAKDALPAWTRSELERRFFRFCSEEGFPRPAANLWIAGHEVDAVFEEQKLVVELDSWRFHGTRGAFDRDRERDGDLLVAGYRVLRVTQRALEERGALLAKLQALLQ